MIIENGMNVKVAQGDLTEKVRVFGSQVKHADYDKIKSILDAQNEIACVGYTGHKIISPIPTAVQGTSGVSLINAQIILTRENSQPLFWKVLLPNDEAKQKNVANAFLNKTIGGSKVLAVNLAVGTKKLA